MFFKLLVFTFLKQIIINVTANEEHMWVFRSDVLFEKGSKRKWLLVCAQIFSFLNRFQKRALSFFRGSSSTRPLHYFQPFCTRNPITFWSQDVLNFLCSARLLRGLFIFIYNAGDTPPASLLRVFCKKFYFLRPWTWVTAWSIEAKVLIFYLSSTRNFGISL